MKRILHLTIVLLLLLYSDSEAFASETQVKMEINEEPQDCLLIGEITKLNNDTVYIDVVRIVTGSVCKKNIILQQHLDGFEVGDGILLSADFINGSKTSCKLAYEYYKIRIDQQKKAKILQSNEAPEELRIEMEWFVNTGKSISSINKHKYYSYDEKGNEIVIYDEKENLWFEDSFSEKYTPPDVEKQWVIFAVIILVLFFIVICPLCIVEIYIIRKKHT